MRLPCNDAVSRRSALTFAALALANPGQRAIADYGSGANVAPPALIPSPFVPTGEMGKTCAVVALGREDVCLEYKKVLTAYDLLQLEKIKDSLSDLQSGDAVAQKLIEDLLKLLPFVEDNNFGEIDKAIPSIVSSASSLDKKLKADVAALENRCKEREASPVARATIKLAQDLVKFVDGAP